MNPKPDYRLSFSQSARLALGVLTIYFPILMYANLPIRTLSFLLGELPFLLVLGSVTGVLFLCWILLTEFILDQTAAYLREEFLIEFRLPTQLLVLLIATLSGILLSTASNFTVQMSQRPSFALPGKRMTISMDGHALADPENTSLIDTWDYFKRSNNALNIVIMLSIFYIAAIRRANRQLKDNQVRTEQLEKETVLAQFAALKNQVSPHFLFNSLSILSSLVRVDPDLSEQFIDKLSRAYRYILEQKDNDRTSLGTELAFIESYTFLLKIRFESGFEVRINVSEAAMKQYQIAPLTLQLLIENAVKHNRMSPEEPLTVGIEQEADCLVVTNHLQPREQLGPSTGVGLQNIINRYRLLTDRAVWVGQEQGNFVVKIPLLT